MYCANREVSRLVLGERVALLRGTQCVETKLDAGEVLDQGAVILSRVPRTQSLEQVAVDLNSRGRHTASLGRTSARRRSRYAAAGCQAGFGL